MESDSSNYELEGPVTSVVTYQVPSGREINKSLLVHAGVHEQIENKFDFREVKLQESEEDDSGPVRLLSATYDEHDVSITRLTIDEYGLEVALTGDSDQGHDFLDDICEVIDGAGLHDWKLSEADFQVEYTTSAKVGFDFVGEDLLNPKLHSLFDDLKDEVTEEKMTGEVHPNHFRVSFVQEPDFSEVAGLDPGERNKVLSQRETRDLILRVDSTGDFYEKIYRVILDAHSSTLHNVLTDLNSRLAD